MGIQDITAPLAFMLLAVFAGAPGVLPDVKPEVEIAGDCKKYIWPKARDEAGRWPGFIRWEECPPDD